MIDLCNFRKNLFENDILMLVIMTDNGLQFVIYKFKECCDKVHCERIQVKHQIKMHVWNLFKEYCIQIWLYDF